MAETHHIQVEEEVTTTTTTEEPNSDPREQTPLLNSDQNHQRNEQENQENDLETHLDKTLQKLYSFLILLGFKQNSILSFWVSWIVFLLIGVFLPLFVLELSNCPGCEKGQIKRFEVDIVASQACLAAASLICLSHNLRKYGIRKFLFVDKHTGHAERFSDLYIQKIHVSISSPF